MTTLTETTVSGPVRDIVSVPYLRGFSGHYAGESSYSILQIKITVQVNGNYQDQHQLHEDLKHREASVSK